jgi:hypothetical protein
MADATQHHSVTRRTALALGGGAAAGLMAGSPAGAFGKVARKSKSHVLKKHGKLPAAKMQEILQTEGDVSSGVLSVDMDRDDLDVTGPQGVKFKPAFELDAAFFFQPLGNDLAIVNGDLPVLPTEITPVIDKILATGLVFQAEHQHFFDLDPMVWFIHLRGVGKPLVLAQAVRDVVGQTAMPFPQKAPSNPTTPLDPHALGKILGGSAQTLSDGVVSVSVERRDRIVIDGVELDPSLNIASTVAFLPLDGSGSKAAVAPDFSMTASEIQPVMKTMRAQGWEIGCLYNQETSESPQLFFSHQFAVGDPVTLAKQVKRGLAHTKAG